MKEHISRLLMCRKEQDKTAIVQGMQQLSYREWHQQAEDMAVNLAQYLFPNSSNAALFLPNGIAYAVAYFGILYCGRTVVPIGTQSKGPEIRSTLENCEIDIVVTNTALLQGVIRTLESYPFSVYVLNADDLTVITLLKAAGWIAKTGGTADEAVSKEGDATAVMLHTSGTLSHPKRVMLTHHNLLSNIRSNIASLALTADDVVLIAMPMNFGYCNTAQFLTHVYLGATIVILEGMFLAKKLISAVQDQHVTNFTGVPTMLLSLLDYRRRDEYDIRSLRYICFGGGKMPVDKLRALIDAFPTVGFVQTYGQTEASPRVTALLPKDSIRKIGSVGRAIPGVTVAVLDERGHPVEQGDIGEVVVRGDNVMKGYYKNESATAAVLHDGWLFTGDLGRFDEEGYLYLTGRKKNMIISGGINIYPEEVEEVLLGHPSVADAMVYGVPDEYMGELPAAKIVVKEGEEISEGVLINHCLDRLSNYKAPCRIEFVKELAKTYNGKTKRNEEQCNV